MKYNHAFTIAFSLENDNPDGEISIQEAIEGMKARVAYLEAHPDEVLESVGAPFDTYEVSDSH